MAHGVGDIFDGDRKRRKQEQAMNAAEARQQRQVNRNTAQGLGADAIAKGKLPFFDITDEEAVSENLANLEGDFYDPFPNYLRNSGDYLINNLEEVSKNIENFTGSSEDLMNDFRGTYDTLTGAQDSAIDRLASIYDGRMQNKLNEFQDRNRNIVQDLQGINTSSADYLKGLQDDVISQGNQYADSLANSVNTAVDLANREFDTRGQGARAMAAAQRAAAGDMARAAQRGVGSMPGGTGQNMMNAMIASNLGQQQAGALAQNIIDNEAGRFEKLGEINPAMADVYRDEALLGNANARLGFGDIQSAAAAENLGLDQGLVDADQQLYNTIMSQQLSNVGLIPSMGLQSAALPSMFGEAGLAGQGAIARTVSPYTQTGTVPAGNTVFNAQPYVPPSSGGNIFDTIGKIPGYIDKGKKLFSGISNIFGGQNV